MISPMNFMIVPLSEVPRGDLRKSDGRDRILVVHDEVVVADCMKTLLCRAGFEAVAAYDGASALEMAFEKRPDLLVSDIGIREIDGIQLAMAVVNAMPECKVLLFSSYERSADVQSAREEGYDFPSLAKPVHPAEMMKQVLACFAGGEMVVVQ